MNIDDLIDELLKKTYKTKYSSGYGYYDSRLISGVVMKQNWLPTAPN